MHVDFLDLGGGGHIEKVPHSARQSCDSSVMSPMSIRRFSTLGCHIFEAVFYCCDTPRDYSSTEKVLPEALRMWLRAVG